jgi:hypothetical protein
MAKDVSVIQSFPSDVSKTFTWLSNPDAISRVCAATGALETTVDVVPESVTGGVRITTVRVLPADVPAAARSFVGETITVTESQVWTASQVDGSRTATVEVSFSGPLGFTGELALSPTSSGCELITRGKMKASVPLIGGSIESVAVENTEKYLRVQERLAREELGS